MTRGLLLVLVTAVAGCVEQPADEPVRVIRSDAVTVVLRGLIDATRTTPPPRYDAMAQAECAKAGKDAVFVGMEQRTTFAFDVTYACGPTG